MNARYSCEFSKDHKGRTCLVFHFSRDISPHLQHLARQREVNDFLCMSMMSGNPALINAEYCADTRAITLTFARGVHRLMVDEDSFATGLKIVLESPVPPARPGRKLSVRKRVAIPGTINPETARMIMFGKKIRSTR